MKKNLKIEIQYRRFGSEELTTHRFSPYALKVHQKRWYIFAYFDPYTMEDGQKREAHFTIFSFDRIENVSITKEKFYMDPDFSVKDYFESVDGVG